MIGYWSLFLYRQGFEGVGINRMRGGCMQDGARPGTGGVADSVFFCRERAGSKPM